jgi:hypothetical protein
MGTKGRKAVYEGTFTKSKLQKDNNKWSKCITSTLISSSLQQHSLPRHPRSGNGYPNSPCVHGRASTTISTSSSPANAAQMQSLA